MALCQASKESWMADFLKDLAVSVQNPVVVNADNQGSIALSRNPVFHDRSKRIDIQYHYARELIRDGRIMLNSIPTADMLADLPSLCRVFATLPCLRESGCFNFFLVFLVRTYARLAARE